jgi:hypothetical protein
MRPDLTQDSLIEALRLFRQAHPELPAVAWEIPRHARLGIYGRLFAEIDDRPLMEQYAEALGANVVVDSRPYSDPEWGQRLALVAVGEFADVPFVLRGACPANSAALAVA